MEPHDFLEEGFYNICCIITLFASNEVCHLGESIYHHHDSILPLRDPWEGHDEVHANVIPRRLRNWQRSVKALVEVTLNHMKCSTPYDYLVNIPTHLGLIEVLLKCLKGRVDAKMTG